jgi:HD superfamily phosphodiesterase
MDRQRAIEKMKKLFSQETRYVDHSLKVLSCAERIYDMEGANQAFVKDVITLGSIFHDTGIPAALKKHGSPEFAFQEKEGEVTARSALAELQVRPDIRERVCYIIAHHHSFDCIDGLDFQILWEADMVVNLEEGNCALNGEPKNTFIERNFKTNAGKKLAAEIL